MNRRSFLGGAAASGVTAVVSYLALAQPANDQVVSLATQVADIDERVDTLETQVAAILGDDAQRVGTTMAVEGDAERVTVEGTGTTVSDPFALVAGRYRINAEAQASNGYIFIKIEVFDPSGTPEEIIDQFGPSPTQWTASVLYNAPTDGEYFVSVSDVRGPWSLTFEPF